MIYSVEFSLEATAELLRIGEVVGSSTSVLQALAAIKERLEEDPAEEGIFLSEGLYYIDSEPLRAFFLIDAQSMLVEITDFRIL